jgi:hypothetical protein
MLDALAEHHLVEYLSSGHADERVVHLGCAVRFQWLHIVVLAIERGRRSTPRLRLCGRRSGALCSPDILLYELRGGRLCWSLEGRDGGSWRRGGKVAPALQTLDGACACLLHCEEDVPQDYYTECEWRVS